MWPEPTGNRIQSAGKCGCTCRLVTQTEEKQQLFSHQIRADIRTSGTAPLQPCCLSLPLRFIFFFLMRPQFRLLRWRAYKRVLCTHKKRKIGAEMFKIGQIKEGRWQISRWDGEIKKKSGGRWKRQICMERYHTFIPLGALLISRSLFSPNWISESWNIWRIYRFILFSCPSISLVINRIVWIFKLVLNTS